VTSLEQATGRDVPMEDVEDRVVAHFASVFERAVTEPALSPHPPRLLPQQR
jgi:hypothetical protein